ncbi:hypothetical protein TVAG_286940 [Trichomonas vaginalis G3]|uniref:Uncharacterized protein n=1 Tax=Trichomonas vaginalis (strain ATCC PRA-98 / G3) TaxID=412133 RepID=A2F3H7_TRIV3|nr:cilia- and flagella-associated protein 58-related family [Trichomonas vaginalis G3]EAY00557.1 hypothetical protein TVAG_286940 [Trichomonas vaginalis G3]KAI5553627.1 cilia- and flagella-associated protein 58-related family [Trichomonas vaginalis G3]|eukprot:XP_001313486.1 hypothetical protein [Trichomonas vaginalis G3]
MSDLKATQDTSTHPAIISLKQLLDQGQISEDVYKRYVFLFNKLNSAFVLSCNNEQSIYRKASEYNKQLKNQKLTISSSAETQQDNRIRMGELRQLVTNIQIELDSIEQKTVEIVKNTDMKNHEIEKLEAKIAKQKEETESTMDPLSKQLTQEIDDLQKSITQLRQKIQSLVKENKDNTERFEKMKERLDEIHQKRIEANAKLTEVGIFPTCVKTQSNGINQEHLTLLAEEKTANNEYSTLNEKLEQINQQIDAQNQEIENTENSTVKEHDEAVDIKLQNEEIRYKMSTLSDKRNQLKMERLHIDKLIREETYAQAQIQQRVDGITKKIFASEKNCLALEESISKLNTEMQAMKYSLKKINEEKGYESEKAAKFENDLKEVNKRVQEMLRSLIKSENISKQLAQEIAQAIRDGNTNQLNLERLTKEQYDLNTQESETALIKDRKAREYAQMIRKIAETKHKAQEKQLDFLDVCKKSEQLAIRQQDLAYLYENVKVDRNRFISIIQTSSQLITELKEKIKIIENEGTVLSNEYNKIVIDCKRTKADLANAVKKREHTIEDLNEATRIFNEYEQQIDFQVAETTRMAKILQSLELQIMNQQQRYALNADDCMDKRRLLIDKQDALCILAEQLAKNEEILKDGEKMLKEKDEDIKMLNLQLNDFARSVELAYKKVPQIREADEKIKELKWELENTKKSVKELAVKLENPSEQDRKRQYTGTDISLKELKKKIAAYEDRNSKKEQQLWEAQILLRDMQDKNHKMQVELRGNDKNSRNTYAKAGKAKSDMMALRRKKKAVISELAVVEAQKMELNEKTKNVKEELVDSARRVKDGEEFDEYAGKMIRMHERDEQLSARRRAGIRDDDDEDNEYDEDAPKGRQKYDAYPTADGLSRPYGAFPVFQPEKKQGNLRFYKREKEPDIII